MSNPIARVTASFLGAAGLIPFLSSAAQAQMLTFTKEKNADQTDCLRQIFHNSSWQKYPNLLSQMIEIAELATTVLNNKGLKDYVYVLEDGIDWCGTAGCGLFIGERLRNGNCRLLYEAAGDTTFTVLRRRDHATIAFTPHAKPASTGTSTKSCTRIAQGWMCRARTRFSHAPFSVSVWERAPR